MSECALIFFLLLELQLAQTQVMSSSPPGVPHSQQTKVPRPSHPPHPRSVPLNTTSGPQSVWPKSEGVNRWSSKKCLIPDFFLLTFSPIISLNQREGLFSYFSCHLHGSSTFLTKESLLCFNISEKNLCLLTSRTYQTCNPPAPFLPVSICCLWQQSAGSALGSQFWLCSAAAV